MSWLLLQGGPVIGLLFVVAALLWCVMLERAWFYKKSLPIILQEVQAQWAVWQCQAQSCEQPSWQVAAIQRLYQSKLHNSIHRGLSWLKTLVKLCPILGLLGTVLGMTQVFDTLALQGTGDNQAMSAGIAAATLPTMVGMAIALSAMGFLVLIEKQAKRRMAQVDKLLAMSTS